LQCYRKVLFSLISYFQDFLGDSVRIFLFRDNFHIDVLSENKVSGNHEESGGRLFVGYQSAIDADAALECSVVVCSSFKFLCAVFHVTSK